MALIGDLMAKLQGGSQGQQATAEQLQPMLSGQSGGLLQGLLAQVGAQPRAQALQGGLMSQVAQQSGAQPPGGQAMSLMSGVADQAGVQLGGQPSMADMMAQLGAQAGAPQGGPDMNALVQQFRQMFGRDPQSQQELAMIGGPAVSQVMG